MPINNITGFPGSQAQRNGESSQAETARKEPTAPQSQTGRPSSSDTVTLTDAAAQLRSLENTVGELPVMDSQRVEDIQRAIENGSYEVDAERVADKMMQFEADFSG
ncbi:MAG TPA: flagellar biosynthesis anti-sigma factor FlgM [Gammaproteobacteria bacterium]|nr:flagellar biosynthesis anti-sigma factor FlgM [Gammaproteobacteria bacterium]